VALFLMSKITRRPESHPDEYSKTASGTGFGYGVSGSGVRVPAFGFRVSSLGVRVPGFGFRVSGFGFHASGFGFAPVETPSGEGPCA
jgi:hypothetical protein